MSQFYRSCPFGTAVSSIESVHENYYNDRKWEINCRTGKIPYNVSRRDPQMALYVWTLFESSPSLKLDKSMKIKNTLNLTFHFHPLAQI